MYKGEKIIRKTTFTHSVRNFVFQHFFINKRKEKIFVKTNYKSLRQSSFKLQSNIHKDTTINHE